MKTKKLKLKKIPPQALTRESLAALQLCWKNLGISVRVGEFTVTRMESGALWMLHVGGEAMQVDDAKLEKILLKFWMKNF